MILRPAGPDDVPAIAGVMAALDDPLEWPGVPGWPDLEHLVSRARVAVAEIDTTVVGFGGSIAVGRDDVRFVTDLYVHPAHHGQGVGTALLDDVLSGALGRFTFSSGDTRALPVYIGAGMRPWWPLLYMAGGAEIALPRGIEVTPATVEETALLSAGWTGVDRSRDFAHYATLPDATGFTIRDGGSVAAIGWARRDRHAGGGRFLAHASIAPDADPVTSAIAIWTAAAAGQRLLAAVPGPHPAVASLLKAGVRIEDRDTFCATDAGLLDPVRILPNSGLL